MSRSVHNRPRPTRERLLELFSYNPDTGFLQRRRPRKNKVAIGCCTLSSSGHYQVFVDGALYPAHSVIWAMIIGEWPPEIDHRNQIKTDNRWDNLRKATRQQNRANTPRHKDSSSPYKGIWARGKKWRARITVDYRPINLGTFNTAEEACAAYTDAARQYFGNFAYADQIPT